MDYLKHYNSLITRAKSRVLEGYVERHHIVPKSMGGNDSVNNLIDLWPEEHLIAHLLLMKIHNSHEMIHAANMMCSRIKNNKEYGFVRRKHANIMRDKFLTDQNPGKNKTKETIQKISNGNKNKKLSEITKQRIKIATTGKNNPMYGKKHSIETKQKIGLKSVGRKPRLGAILSEETKKKCSIAAKNRTPIKCIHCNKIICPSNHARWHGDNCKVLKNG